ncbi:MAG: cell division protein FtsQ/DivIB, partial [Pseudonocardiaceae bacterium]
RSPRRDTQRPSAATRERSTPSRGRGGTRAPHDRQTERLSRVTRGGHVPDGDHDDLLLPRGAEPGAVAAAATVVPGGTPPTPRPVRARRRWLIAALVVLLLAGGAAWGLLGTSLLDARSVQVVGTRELPADVVRTVAAVPLGTSMLRLDTQAIANRVAALPRVEHVQVRCGVDGAVQIQVTERTPVAVLRRGDAVHLVDVTGTDFAVVPAPPLGLPELQVHRAGPRDAATAAALTVLSGLPEWLRVRVRWISAKSPADVVLRLDDGRKGTERKVRWGGVEQGDRKAAVLGPLLTQPGEIYDVSSPTLPTIA